MTGDRYTIGIDFGTLSARALVVRVADGREMGTVAADYRNGVVAEALPAGGQSLAPDWALQIPSDYIDAVRRAVPAAIDAAGIDRDDVIGIGTDFTACTVLPVLRDGTPLCELPELADRPHAYPKLWRHHAAQSQANRINALARDRDEPWLRRYGGAISSEWEFAKALQLLDEDPEVYARADLWVELADWIVWQLTGTYVRSACAAGYKGILQDGRYPDPAFLAALDPGFAEFAATKLAAPIGQLGDRAGALTAAAAAWTGLRPGLPVAVGNVDAHAAAPAARAIEPGQMLAIMGTSTCHMINAESLREIPGMCGVVQDGIVAGLYGYEAGQSGVGDILAWYVHNQVPGRYTTAAADAGQDIHDYLTDLARSQPVGGHGLMALDWESGNRSVLVDHDLSGVLIGPTLTTRAEDVYRALIESTAFGTRTIVEAFIEGGVPVTEFVATGGLIKNDFIMQTYADVLRMPVATAASEQGSALGAAIHGAAAAGAYPDVRTASASMGRRGTATYEPDHAAADAYDRLYAEYVQLHDYFGRGTNDVMHRLRGLRRDALSGRRPQGASEAASASATASGSGAASASAAAPRVDSGPTVEDQLRQELVRWHTELVRQRLVVWTAGNVSCRLPGTDRFLIKPSGVDYEQLGPADLVLCDLDGNVVAGSRGSDRSPSSDTATHAYVYRHMPHVGGVAHTHSVYACAWAARGEPIPCVATGIADAFGGDVPVGPFATVGDDSIGRGIVETLAGERSRAVLMRNHGPFTIGRDARDAVKAAVLVEDAARVAHLARAIGDPTELPAEAVDGLFARYQNVYGQRPQGPLE
jgi:L-ribulokinase